MKLGVEVKNEELSLNLELIFWSNHPNSSNLYPHPPYPLQNANFANFGLIWIKLGVEVKNGQQTSSP